MANLGYLDLRPPPTAERPLSARALAVVLAAGGLVGFAAAFVLAVEKFRLLTDPFYTPSCTLNATLSCGPVMSSPQAEVFGFPNPLLGIAGFAVVAATGAVLLAGGRVAGWYWAGLQAGVTAAVVFVHWLIVQSLFVIGALCPYCMVVWTVTIPLFWYVTLRNLAAVAPRLPTAGRNAVGFLLRYHSSLLLLWLAAVAGLVVASVGLR
ncbi:MAG: vitamin K epoxide reductase family protein [Actinomycetes bacterium]